MILADAEHDRDGPVPLLHRLTTATTTPDQPKLLPPQPRRVYLVGGGSVNAAITGVLGDVLGGAEGVYRLDVGGNACALGGAYKAVWALENKKGDSDVPSDGDLFGADKTISRKPDCPGGGTYDIRSVGEKPTCTVSEHVLPN